MISSALISVLALGPAPAPPNLPPAAAPGEKDNIEAPPGLVLIEGGKTQVGTDPQVIVPIIVRTNFRKLVGETPQHKLDVEDFYAMVTEVTNEQYAAYVAATGAKPPQSWGNDAIDAGALEHAEKEGERIQALREAGEPVVRHKFNRADWWDENWQTSEYEVPADRLIHPVEYVSYDDVLGYCRWAGLRPMTEFEFQRAGRGKTENIYPWGDEFESGRAATFEAGTMDCWPVGSFEGGATEEGLHDLIGNVWEWTSSAYLPYPKYKPIEVEFGPRRKETCFTDFDGSQRVVVGGGFPNDKDACRLSVRRATNQSQATQAMGFRCAASPRPGLDLAASILRFDVPTYVIPEGVRHAPQFVIGMDRWLTQPGTCQVEGYQLITGYDHFLFTPVESIDSASLKELSAQSHKKPVHLGILSLSVTIESPALEPGVYLVAWRAEGEGVVRGADDAEGDADQAGAEPPIWSTEDDQLIFYDLTGKPVLATKARSLDFKRLKPGNVMPRTVEPSEEQRQAGVKPFEEILFDVPLPAKGGTKGFELDLRLRMPVGTLGEGWRRTQ